jgi:hypothetical protein
MENPTRKAQQITKKEKHNMISTKAQQSSPWGETTCGNQNFALFALIFDIFSDSVSLK